MRGSTEKADFSKYFNSATTSDSQSVNWKIFVHSITTCKWLVLDCWMMECFSTVFNPEAPPLLWWMTLAAQLLIFILLRPRQILQVRNDAWSLPLMDAIMKTAVVTQTLFLGRCHRKVGYAQRTWIQMHGGSSQCGNDLCDSDREALWV